jgi:hypothetical protein
LFPLPALVEWILLLKIIAVALGDIKYIIYNIPTTPSRPVIHALQILVTYMPQYYKSILPREKMNLFTCNKVELPSEFKCESNMLISSQIGHELSV